MFVLGSLFLVGLQSLEPQPSAVEVGDSVRVVVRDADGRGLAGIPVTVRAPGGEDTPIGETGADGGLDFAPGSAGDHRLAALVGDRRLLAPLHAVEPPRRWLYAVLGAVAGVGLLLAHLRWFRGRGRPA